MDARDMLRQFALEQLGPAQRIILEGEGLTPMLCFIAADNAGVAEVPQIGQPELKPAVLMALREMLKQFEARCYAITLEAWVGEKQSTENLKDYSPSKDPQRKEGILVSAADIFGNKLLVICRITRGETVTFSEPEVLNTTQGPMLELLDEKPTIN